MKFNTEDRERPEKFTEDPKPWELFAAAIIEYACKDYKGYTGKGRVPIERFIRSEFFHNISNIDPEWLIKNLREMYPIRTGFIRGI